MQGRLTPYLRRRVLGLPLGDRMELVSQILSRSPRLEFPVHSRLEFLAGVLVGCCGVDVRVSRDRSLQSSVARTVFVYAARREGFTQEEIGRFIGRNHSTVCCAERRMQDAFAAPQGNREHVELLDRFMKELYERV